MESNKIWTNILSKVKSEISSSTFKTWFAGSFALDFKNGGDRKLLIVALKNNFLKEQIESRYMDVILRLGRKSVGENLEVVFVVSDKKPEIKTERQEPIFSGTAQGIFLSKPESLNPLYTFSNMAVGDSNNLAFLASRQVAGNPGRLYNPLLIYGPSGVGKTHLLQAIGNEVISKTDGLKVVYVTAERFTNEYIDALRNRTVSAFRQKYRLANLLLVDDVQFLSGKESTQDEFFYTFSELLLSGGQIVLVSDRHPQTLGKLKQRLVSRFLGGMTVDIGLPDFELKLAILKTKCALKNISVSEDILSYIAKSADGGARELEGSLVSVLGKISLGGGKLSLDEVRETIGGLRIQNRKANPGEVTKAVCSYFSISERELCGPSRKSRLVQARQYLMFLLRKEASLSLSEIGGLLGGRDHSTVIHGIDKISREVDSNREASDRVYRIKAAFSS